MSRAADRGRRAPRGAGRRLVMLLPSALQGAGLLAGAFRTPAAARPASLMLLVVFTAYFLWRIGRLLRLRRADDADRMEAGLLAVLAADTVLEAVGAGPGWSVAVLGVLHVLLAAGMPWYGPLALAPAALGLRRFPGGWIPVVQVGAVAAAAVALVWLENRRRERLRLAYEKLRRDAQVLGARSTVEAPARGLDRIDDALYRFLEALKTSTAAHSAVLVLRAGGGEDLYVRELVSDSDRLNDAAVLRLGATAFHWIVRNRKPLNIGKLRNAADRLGYYAGAVRVQSFLGVPMVTEGGVEGVLAVDSLQPRAFDEVHRTVLERAARLVGAFLEQVRAFETVKREARDFRLLHELSRRMALCEREHELVDRVVACLVERFPEPAGGVVLVREDGELEMAAATGGWAGLRGTVLPRGRGLVGWVLASRNYLHYDRARPGGRRPLFGPGVDVPEFQSLLLYPLQAHGEVLGVLCLASAQAGAFDAPAVAFCEILARQAGQGLLQLRSLAELRRLATTDPLTGLANRRAFLDRLEAEVARSRRYPQPLALVMVDVDHFKRVNDVHGHPAGDEVLRRIAGVLRSLARETDLVARYGGEEFALLLPNTDEAGARALAGRIRASVAAAGIPWEDRTLRVTASLGVSALEGEADAPEQLVSRADRALYVAKRTGRNRVVVFSEVGEYAEWDGEPA